MMTNTLQHGQFIHYDVVAMMIPEGGNVLYVYYID